MPTPIHLVKVGMNMTEGVVEQWCVADGANVEAGALLYRLETEKVNLDVEAEVSGTVRHAVGEGVTLEPGAVVGWIYAPDEAIPDEAGSAAEPAQSSVRAAGSEDAVGSVARPAAAQTPTGPSRGAGGRILSSPAARRLAGELGVAIAGLEGSGPGGRIVEADVKAAARSASVDDATAASPSARKLARELEIELDAIEGSGPGGRVIREDVARAASASAAPPDGAGRRIPLKGMRRTIARRMHESLRSMAQLSMDMDVCMDEAVDLRSRLVESWQDDGVRVGYTDLVIAAVARALQDHPQMNASIDGDEIVLHGAIHVGMAVALDDGLIVPVIRDADRLDLTTLARETARLAAAARDGRLGVDDVQGATFTVTALGAFGVDAFTPIVDAPQAGILGVNRLRDAVGWAGETPVKQQRMNLSLSWDHRVLDGAPAARFLATVRSLLEAPLRLLR